MKLMVPVAQRTLWILFFCSGYGSGVIAGEVIPSGEGEETKSQQIAASMVQIEKLDRHTLLVTSSSENHISRECVPYGGEVKKAGLEEFGLAMNLADARGALLMDHDAFLESCNFIYPERVQYDSHPNALAVRDLVEPVPGEWQSIGGVPSGCNARIEAVEYSGDGVVYLGGSFSVCGDIPASGIVRLDLNTREFQSLGHGDENGVNGTVFDIVKSGGDLYVGGTFTAAGGMPANRIARWDGQQWHSLGIDDKNGVDSFVWSLEEHQGDIYVGGIFENAGGQLANRIARWDGGSWYSVDDGLVNGFPDSVGIDALLSRPEGLYAGGVFSIAGNVSANNIALWNGEQWQPLGEGENNGVSGRVFSLASWNGEVYAGHGSMSVWNGEQWRRLDSGSSPFVVRAVAATVDGVYVGGFIGGFSADSEYRGVAFWDGDRFESVGDGILVDNSAWTGALVSTDVGLVVAGRFGGASEAPASHVAIWDGLAWSAAGLGTGQGFNDRVQFLAEFDGSIYAGGWFTRAGDALARRFAVNDESGWRAPGPSEVYLTSSMRYMRSETDGLYVNTIIDDGLGDRGRRLGRWDGLTWLFLEDSDTRPATLQPVVAVYQDKLHAVRVMQFDDGSTANVLAFWDGENWLPVQGKQTSGFNGQVSGVEVFDESLCLIGGFTEVDGVPVNKIACWNGDSWRALGTADANGFDVLPLAIKAVQGELFVGGNFRRAGGIDANFIARWNGSAWQSLGVGENNGVNSVVLSIEEVGNDVYAGGVFNRAGRVAARGVARWDGRSWAGIGHGAGIQGNVESMLFHEGVLFVGGRISEADGEVSSNLAIFEPAPHPRIEPALDTVNFSTSPESGSSLADVQFVNSGDADLEISGVNIVDAIGRSDAAFAVLSDGCSGALIAPGGSCSIELTFVPSGSELQLGVLEIRSNVPGGSIFLELIGNDRIFDDRFSNS
ncbi:hypothetical protein G3I74_01415 [Wenzhouxiangella sp. C33]|uniref:Choice-of-anchor D domain-containing protein n=2 Tax=Wenzhouxiangella limi TaxID=2707351 RepID=A0A845VAP3_9GAMM|nr:hypothetical protein [Wenzhouxiangella limi]